MGANFGKRAATAQGLQQDYSIPQSATRLVSARRISWSQSGRSAPLATGQLSRRARMMPMIRKLRHSRASKEEAHENKSRETSLWPLRSRRLSKEISATPTVSVRMDSMRPDSLASRIAKTRQQRATDHASEHLRVAKAHHASSKHVPHLGWAPSGADSPRTEHINDSLPEELLRIHQDLKRSNLEHSHTDLRFDW